VITLQPDESLRLDLMAKVPGEGMKVQPISLDVALSEAYQTRQWDAYERLIMDVVHGKTDAVHAARRTGRRLAVARADPEGMGARRASRRGLTAAGTWGPTASSTLIARDGQRLARGGLRLASLRLPESVRQHLFATGTQTAAALAAAGRAIPEAGPAAAWPGIVGGLGGDARRWPFLDKLSSQSAGLGPASP